jgi:hypothetical protein
MKEPGQLFYEAMYAADGGIWNCVEERHKTLWAAKEAAFVAEHERRQASALAKLRHDVKVNGPMMLHFNVPSEQWPNNPRGLGIGTRTIEQAVEHWPEPPKEKPE